MVVLRWTLPQRQAGTEEWEGTAIRRGGVRLQWILQHQRAVTGEWEGMAGAIQQEMAKRHQMERRAMEVMGPTAVLLVEMGMMVLWSRSWRRRR